MIYQGKIERNIISRKIGLIGIGVVGLLIMFAIPYKLTIAMQFNMPFNRNELFIY